MRAALDHAPRPSMLPSTPPTTRVRVLLALPVTSSVQKFGTHPVTSVQSSLVKISASYHAMRHNYCGLACGNARLQLSVFAATVTSTAPYAGKI